MGNPFGAGRGFRRIYQTKLGNTSQSLNPFRTGPGLSTASVQSVAKSGMVSIPLEQGSLFLILPNLWFGAMTWAGFYLRNIASSFTNGNRESYKGGDIVKSAVNFLKKSANRITKSLCIHYDSPVLRSKKLNTFSPILNNQLRYHIKCFITRY